MPVMVHSEKAPSSVVVLRLLAFSASILVWVALLCTVF
jgi:hypothetical protein